MQEIKDRACRRCVERLVLLGISSHKRYFVHEKQCNKEMFYQKWLRVYMVASHGG